MDIDFSILGPGDFQGIALILNNVQKDKLMSCRFFVTHFEPLLSFVTIDDALSRHTKLEVLDVSDIYVGEEDLLQISYPFPESLRALPSLRSIGFSSPVQEGEMPTLSNFRTSSTTSLQKLAFSCIKVDAPLGMALAAIVSRNSNLESVAFNYCHLAGDNTQPFFEEVGRSTSLRTLNIGRLGDAEGYQVAADGLKNNKGLTELILTAENWLDEAEEYHANGLGHFLDGIKLSNMPLGKLCLYGYHLNGDFLSEKMRSYLATAPLKTLVLSDCTFSEHLFCSICSGVAASPTLVEFDIRNAHLNTRTFGFRRGISSLAEKRSLEVLRMGFRENNDLSPIEELIDAISKFRNSTAIKELNFSRAVCSYVQGGQLLEALKQNYTLEYCKYDMERSVSNQDKEYIQSHTKMILKLNKHGRRYLVEGKPKERGVSLLGMVSEDLDSIFYHLLENPSLCCRNNPTKDHEATKNHARGSSSGVRSREFGITASAGSS